MYSFKHYILLFFMFLSVIAYSQEFKIKEEGNSVDEPDLVSYLIKKEKMSKLAQQHVINRFNYIPLETIKCDDKNIITVSDSSYNSTINISLTINDFSKSDHKIKYDDDDDEVIEKINGKSPYGSFYGLPYNYISNIKILFNNQEIIIPNEAYDDLYNITTCKSEFFKRKIEVYISKDEQYIYLYLYGGNAANTFFTKLIFDKEKYLDRTLVLYGDLSQNASFHENFIGF